jgi:hypothetical protein
VRDLILPRPSESETVYVCADSVLERVPGLTEFLAWIDERGLKKAAVTNAPRENARVMLAALGLGCVHSLHPNAFAYFTSLREHLSTCTNVVQLFCRIGSPCHATKRASP